jgi:3-hydroxyacyl-CoA dehydrogenase
MVRRINKVAVIGSGIMGGGIAALCASAGVPTLLLDIVPFDLKDEEKGDKKARNRIVQAGLDSQLKIKPAAFMDRKKDPDLLTIGNLEDDIEKLKDCDLIIEVIVENLKIKHELFTKVEKYRKSDAIVASNTSGLPLSAMAEGRSQGFKENFIIMHFFNPPRYMKLLELVAGPDTKKEVCDFIEKWGETILGKGIVWAKDTPNFIGNRIGLGAICEAMKLAESEDIPLNEFDAVVGPAFGMPNTAVFALADLVGLDTIDHLSENSYKLLEKDEKRDMYKLPEFFKNMIKNGQLGNKTKDKGGFYKKEVDAKTWKKISKVLNIKTGEFVEFDKKAKPELAGKIKSAKTLGEKASIAMSDDSKFGKLCWKLAAHLFIYSANRVPEISDTVVGIDNAMKWGYAYEAGPFEMWDMVGVKKTVERMEKDGLKVPENVKKMLTAGNESFYRINNGVRQYFDFASNSYKDIKKSETMIFLSDVRASNKVVKSNPSASLLDIGDGVFCLEFHSKMNAINKEMVEFMGITNEYVNQNGIGLVIGNQAHGIPGAFSAGGDLAYMIDHAKNKRWSEIENFIKAVHKNILAIKYATIPVVAAPYGMTLGGGCETVLSAHKIVAHAELYMGLVEIGAGLVPGGCGMINLWQRMIESVPGPVDFKDYGSFFIPAFLSVAQAKVSMSAAEAKAMGFLKPTDKIIFNKDALIGEAKKEVLRMSQDGYRPPIKRKIPVIGQEGQGMIWAEMLNMKHGGYLPAQMEFIAKKACYCMSGGEARCGQLVSEEYLQKLELDTFIELWQTENTQKMAEHILTTGKPLMI